MKKNILVKLTIILLLGIFSCPVFAGDGISKWTEDGEYNVEMTIKGEELKPGKNTISLSIRDIKTSPLEGARVTLSPWMPSMGHGIDIKPVITEKGGGRYEVENIYISMIGLWELRIDIDKGGVEDRVVFEFPNVGGEDAAMDHTAHMGHHNAPGQAPIGVMGGHTHHKGKWMASYRYMYMAMDGNRDGNDRLSVGDVHNAFMVSPTEMSMQMHMLGIMYAPSNSLTLMTMIPYIEKEMDHETRTGAMFTTKTDGIGDIKFTVLYKFYEKAPVGIHANIGVSIPTGSIDEKGDTPMGQGLQLPYPMQLGSGTLDLLPGVTYLGSRDPWSWGSQITAVLRLGENDNDYTLGDEYSLSVWFNRTWTDWLGTSIRIDGKYWDDIEGSDPLIAQTNPMGMPIVPTADPDLRGGKRIDLLFGVDVVGLNGALKNARLAIEAGVPIYQHLDGPQLETDWLLTAGLQWMF